MFPLAAIRPKGGSVRPILYTVFNSADKSANFTLSESDLRATATGGGNIGVRVVHPKTTGKYYVEVYVRATHHSHYDGWGLVKMSQALDNMYAGTGGVIVTNNGAISVNGTDTLTGYYGDNVGSIKRLAMDLDNQKFWSALDGGNWNNGVLASQNPATNTGGVDISGAGSINGQQCAFYCASSTASIDGSVNFGATPFAFSVPAGFTRGWPQV